LLNELAANIRAESPVIESDALVVVQDTTSIESSEKQNGSVFDFFGRLRQKN
jgi:hypothetical protein